MSDKTAIALEQTPTDSRGPFISLRQFFFLTVFEGLPLWMVCTPFLFVLQCFFIFPLLPSFALPRVATLLLSGAISLFYPKRGLVLGSIMTFIALLLLPYTSVVAQSVCFLSLLATHYLFSLMREEIGSYVQEHTKAIEELEEETSLWRGRFQTISQQNSLHGKNLEDKIASLQKEIEKKAQELISYKELVQQANDFTQQMQEEKMEALAAVDALRETYDKTNDYELYIHELQEQIKELNEMKVKYYELQQNTANKGALEEKEAQIAKLQTQVEELNRDYEAYIDSLKEELEELKTRYYDLQQEPKEQSAIEDQHAYIEKLEQEIQELKTKEKMPLEELPSADELLTSYEQMSIFAVDTYVKYKQAQLD